MKFPKGVKVGEFYYEFPLPPVKKEEVLFWNLPSKEQYWRRNVSFPKIFYDYNSLTKENATLTKYSDDGILLSLSVEDTQKVFDLREKEMIKRREGIWFMNNGEPTYITGDHYFILQWGAMFGVQNPFDNSPYGTYRKFQRDFLYMIDKGIKDPSCKGLFAGKPKKTGITQIVTLVILNRSTMYRDKIFAFISKSLKDCRDVNFMFYVYGLDRLPNIFKPTISIETQTRRKFANIRTKATNSKNSILASQNNGMGLNTEVNAFPTKADVLDGPKIFMAQLDEFPKMEDPYPGLMFSKSSETVKMQNKIVGFLLLTAYPPENDSRSFTEAKKIWYDSKLSTVSKDTGRTNSELWTHYISALDSFDEYFLSDHPDWEKYGKYGNTDPEAIRHIIMINRDQKKNDRDALQAYIRQYSISEEEMWMVGGAGSRFDNIRIGRQNDDNMASSASGNREYQEGHLEWKDERLGEVIWVPLPESEIVSGKQDKMELYHPEWLPTELFNPHIYKPLRDRKGDLRPDDNSIIVGATDPTEYALKDDIVTGSKNAITAIIFSDTPLNTRFGRQVTDRMIFQYLYRPDDPLEYYEDVVKCILFFGMYTHVEGNKMWITTKLKEEALHNYILYRTPEKTIEPYKIGGKNAITTTIRAGSVEVIEEICRAISTHIRRPEDGLEVDNLKLYYSRELCKQLMEFKPLDTKRFDLAMCWGLNLVAMQSLRAYRLKGIRQDVKYDASMFASAFSKLGIALPAPKNNWGSFK